MSSAQYQGKAFSKSEHTCCLSTKRKQSVIIDPDLLLLHVHASDVGVGDVRLLVRLQHRDGRVGLGRKNIDLKQNKASQFNSAKVASDTGLGRAAFHCYPALKVVIGCIPFFLSGRKWW